MMLLMLNTYIVQDSVHSLNWQSQVTESRMAARSGVKVTRSGEQVHADKQQFPGMILLFGRAT